MRKILAGLFALFALNASAIEGLRISVVQSNVVLSWPSQTNESFIIQWRSSFDTNHPWLTLSTNHLATTGTNWTVFTHTNTVTYPEPCSGSTNGGSSEIPAPSFSRASGSASVESSLPPLPWDESTWSKPSFSKRGASLNNLEPMDEEPECTNATFTAGFYRVVRTGLSLFGVTNGTLLSESVEIPVEVGLVNQGDLVSVVVVETNGTPLGSFSHENRSGLTVAKWQTGYSTNGSYSLRADAQVGDVVLSQLTSPSVNVVVSNLFTFIDDYPVAGFLMLFEGRSVFTNGTFTAHIHGEGAPSSTNEILSFGGTISPSGQLLVNVGGGVQYSAVQIDMSDINGNQRPDSSFTVGIVAQVGGGHTRTTTNVVPSELLWPTNTLYVSGTNIIGPTKFTIGFQPIYGDASLGNPSAVNLQLLISGIYTAAEGRQYGLGVRPGDNQTVNALWNQQMFTTWLTSDIRDYQVRNLFYFGHGSDNFIGTVKPLPGVGRPDAGNITVTDLRQVLGTNQPYRFVFLYGCNTARGDLPLAFGIPKKQMFREDFAARGLRARAFVGFKDYQWTGIVGSLPNTDAQFSSEFFNAWQGTYPAGHPRAGQPRGLKDALILGAQFGNTNSPVWSGYNNVQIYGAEDLLWTDIIP